MRIAIREKLERKKRKIFYYYWHVNCINNITCNVCKVEVQFVMTMFGTFEIAQPLFP